MKKANKNMNHRKSTDTCLLCQINYSVKCNSHILPKFLSTSFLKNGGVRQKGFELDSETYLNKKPRPIQDSPKEDYVLCEECESYLSVLEGITSDNLKELKIKQINKEHSTIYINKEVEILNCNEIDKKTIYLFIYSLFWRASISNHDFFENINLNKEFEEKIRKTLFQYKQTKKNTYLEQCDNNRSLEIFPTLIITCEKFKEGSANLLYAPNSYNPYTLIVDKFSFLLFEKIDEHESEFIKQFSNNNVNDCKIIIFSEQMWHDIILKKVVEIFKERVKN